MPRPPPPWEGALIHTPCCQTWDAVHVYFPFELGMILHCMEQLCGKSTALCQHAVSQMQCLHCSLYRSTAQKQITEVLWEEGLLCTS